MEKTVYMDRFAGDLQKHALYTPAELFHIWQQTNGPNKDQTATEVANCKVSPNYCIPFKC